MNVNSESSSPIHSSVAQQIAALAICLVVCFSVAAIGGMATASGLESWYQTLEKPSWNPPNWIFGPVWSLLYCMMGIAAWLVWRAAGWKVAQLALVWFMFHLMLNALWSFFFFGLQRPGLAAIEIVVLWLSILISMILFWRHSKLAAVLLLPYLFWVSFASALNFTIWSLNS